MVFQDSDDNGIGDFDGLASRLDYLQDLGVNAVWLLPFYPSPLRDDGYDIADYRDVHPDYGSMRSFRRFLREAHRRDINVITELVLNHTSDQHPWFRRARRARPGTSERDFYVWSDTTDRYRDARVIFRDFESSNWSWDPVAGQHYWHRFYSHQPDLNFENPAVHAAMREVFDFWLREGVDGFRLDAVPYLYEAEGTNCENLPQTHEYLRGLRHYVDERAPNRMLLAEANQGRRRRVLRGRRRVSPRLQLPDHAAALHGRAHGGPVPAGRDPRADAADPGRLPVGNLPPEPRRADPRDGHRRRTRLHVPRLRRRPADAGQPRHPAPARAAAPERSPSHRVAERTAVHDAGNADHLLRRRDRHGRQRVARRPQQHAHPDAVERRP
ncbi:MAG: hypothetical protein E6G60_14520 [Actinobacteria bacterium]|nr:MAG: hypothetical protein E6G60_14520 [Actinomycetota bacterium]